MERPPQMGCGHMEGGDRLGVYGETLAELGQGTWCGWTAGTGRGNTHSLKWGRGTWRGAAMGQGCP